MQLHDVIAAVGIHVDDIEADDFAVGFVDLVELGECNRIADALARC